VIGIVAAVVALLVLLCSPVFMGAGKIGVVTQFGGVTGRVLSPGLSFIFPVAQGQVTLSTQETVYETMPAAKKDADTSGADYTDYEVDTNTSDGQHVDISYSAKFSVDPRMATDIVNDLGDLDAVTEKVIKFHSRILARQVPRTYTAAELYMGDGLERAQGEIFELLQAKCIEAGVQLIDFGIREIVFTADYMNAVEEKQIQAEAVTTEKYRAEQAVHKKAARITDAEGKAAAIEIEAEALRDNQDIVQLRFVEALADQNIDVMIIPPGAVLPFLDLGAP